MTPGERTMPVVTAAAAGRGWVVTLPDGRTLRCPSRARVRRLVEQEACGAAIRWIE